MKQERIKFLHDCLLIKNILVIGDLHIGYDEQFHGKAVFPSSQLEDIIEKLRGVFRYLNEERIKLKKIIFLGDVKHDFGKISDREWRETKKFFDFLRENIDDKCELIVVKGNHDNMLEPIAKKRKIFLKDFQKVIIEGKKWCFMHGNRLFKQCLDSDYFVFGHLHPAITLSDEYKTEKYKCFLKGKWKGKGVFILPSFTEVSFGYDLRNIEEDEVKEGKIFKKNKIKNNDFFVIPNKDLKRFEIIIYDNGEGKEYNFGKLKSLNKL